MSRPGVSEPRPRSAWILATVASASLWITGQLSPFTIAVQVAALAFTYATRTRPFEMQKSAITLNVCMVAITTTTISVALKGHPAVVSLAHFAALSQVLQLLDARPRKTEFLFVTLSLFQVILAANLTDSVFFPPLLVAFLVSATWTLMLHTLRTEAAQHSHAHREPVWATDAGRQPRGLVRMTVLASTASLLVALVLFVTLPRFRSSIFQAGVGQESAVSGFSDRLELGTFGQIRKDHSVVLRVETVEGQEPELEDGYWRGLSFDTFDGRSWSITPVSEFDQRRGVSGSPRFGVNVLGGPAPGMLVQRIVREPVQAGVLFGAGLPRRIEGPFDRLDVDANDGFSNPRQESDRVRYTVWTDARSWSEDELRADRTALPQGRLHRPTHAEHRYLALPDFDPGIRELASKIVASAATDADRARAIERHLREHGSYTDAPPPMGTGDDSPIEDFLLGGLAGHCEYFASGMVVLARSVGLPSRVVNGFAGGRRNELGGFVELTSADAHAWVEIHYADAGWVRYDPTPPDLRLRAAGGSSFADRLAELGSAIELWWFQRVVDFDSSDQVLALKAAWRGWRALGSFSVRKLDLPKRRSEEWLELGDLPLQPLVLLLVGIGVVALAVHWRRAPRRRATRLPRTYARALRLLARHGFVRTPATTARDFARDVEGDVAPAAARAFQQITESYLGERFGAEPTEGEGALATLRQALRRHRARARHARGRGGILRRRSPGPDSA